MPSPQYNPRRQQKPPPPKKSKRSGASPTMRGEKTPLQIPGWLWLVAGVAVGLFIAFLVKLSHAPEPSQASGDKTAIAVKTAPAKPEPAADKTANAGKADDKPAADKGAADKAGADKDAGDKTPPANPDKIVTKFDFYTLLPEREVLVPNDRDARSAAEKAKPAQGQAQSAAPEQLFLQVGSFRSAQEAERRRAQIAALGLDAKVESVVANADTWYRVQAGPFTSREQLSRTRDQLSAAGIESLLLKQKPQG